MTEPKIKKATKKVAKKKTTKKVVVKTEAEQLTEKAVMEAPVGVNNETEPVVQEFDNKGLSDQEVRIIEVKYQGNAELANKKFKVYKDMTNSEEEYSAKLTRVYGI